MILRSVADYMSVGRMLTAWTTTKSGLLPGVTPLQWAEKMAASYESTRTAREIPSMAWRDWSIYSWYAHGANVIKPSEMLLKALALTSCGSWDELRLPHNTILLELPVAPLTRVFASRVAGRQIMLTLQFSDANKLMVVDINSDGEIDENPHDPPHIVKLMELARDYVWGVCAWMEANNAKKKSLTRKQQRRREKKPQRQWPTIWIAGGDVTLSPELREAADDYIAGQTSKPRAGWKVRAQHVVRGHWRNQVCGPKRAERKRIWIEPHLRGPESKVAWSHIYKAGEAGETA